MVCFLLQTEASRPNGKTSQPIRAYLLSMIASLLLQHTLQGNYYVP